MLEVSNYKTLRSEIAGVPVARLATEFGGTPVYVYDAATIVKRCAQLRPFGVVRYAQKACSNIAIIKLVREQGAVVDAVSAGEIMRALAAGYKPEEIAYTSDIFDADALALVTGEARGCVVNVGSPDMIAQIGERLGADAAGFELTIRVNPGFGHGHSRKTNTGGEFAKHGIWHTEIADCVALAGRYGMTVSGVHMHIGSGTDFEHLKQVCDAMTAAAKEVGASVKTISCGGGLPVPYQSGEEFIDLEEFARLWHETKAALEKELADIKSALGAMKPVSWTDENEIEVWRDRQGPAEELEAKSARACARASALAEGVKSVVGVSKGDKSVAALDARIERLNADLCAVGKQASERLAIVKGQVPLTKFAGQCRQIADGMVKVLPAFRPDRALAVESRACLGEAEELTAVQVAYA